MTADPIVQAPPPNAAKPPVVSRIARILAAIVLCLLLLVTTVLIFTQTAWFRGIVADQLVSMVESETNGTIEIGEIGGDLFSGFVLRDVRLRLKNDTATIFESPFMLAKYSLYDILTSDKLSASEIVLSYPKITFFRDKGDSLWNFQKFIKPSTGPVDTSQFRGIIEIGSLRIQHASLSVRDNYLGTSDTKSKDFIDWGNMNVEELDVDLGAKIFGASFQVLDLKNVSFVERRSGFSLRRLSGVVGRSDDEVKIEGLNLVTNETALKLSARIDSAKILSGGSFEDMADSKIELHLDAAALSAKELAGFLPYLNFMANVPSLKLDAEGTFRELRVDKGELRLRRNGNLDFNGTIANFQEPEKLRLDISLRGNGLSQRTLDNFVPGLGITGFEQYGIVNIDRLEYHGGIQSFKTSFDVASNAGDAVGTASLDIERKTPTYELHAVTSNLNLAAITGTEELDSKLNLKFDARGSGFDPREMNTEFVVSAYDASRLGPYSVASFAANGNIKRGVLDARNIMLSMGNDRLLSSEYAIIDLFSEEQQFDVSFDTKDFPIAEFVPDLPESMRVTATANLMGSLSRLTKLTGSLQAKVQGLYFNGGRLAPVQLNAVFERDSLGIRTDRIESNVADLTLKGNYKFDRLAELIPKRIQAVAYALDSSVAPPETEQYYEDTSVMVLRIDLKDVRPLAFLWNDITFLSQAKLSAGISLYPAGRIDANLSGTVPALLIQSESDSARSVDFRIYDTTHVLFDVSNFTSAPRTLFDSLKTNIVIATDSTLRLFGSDYSRPKVSAEFIGRDLAFGVSTGIGTDLNVYLRGKGGLATTTFDVTLDSAAVKYNGVLWQSEGASHLQFDPNGYMSFDTLRFYRPELGYDPEGRLAQRIQLGGVLRNDTIEYAFASIPQLKLNELPLYFSDTSSAEFARDLRGRVSQLDVDLKGTLAKPVMNGKLLIRNFTYQDIFLDSCIADLHFDDLNLSGKLRVHIDSAKYAVEAARSGRRGIVLGTNNGLDIKIDSLPLIISFGEYPEKLRDEVRMKKMNVALSVAGEDFPINLLTPVLPFVSDIGGFADVKLDIRGTMEDLVLKGQAVVDSGTLTLSATNVSYIFNGNVLFEKERLGFEDFTLWNLPSDDPSGQASLTGKIDLDGFSIRNLDFEIRTDRLTVLTNESQAAIKTIYGPLAIETGRRPLRFYGSLDAPHLDGDVIIPQAYLTMPQAQSASKAQDKGIVYRILDIRQSILGETTTVTDTLEELVFLPSLYDELDLFGLKPTPWLDTSQPEAVESYTSGSGYDFVDALLYDEVTLDIPGDSWLIMYLNNTNFGDQISAELKSDGRLHVHRSRPGPENLEFTGTLTLTERSSYKFLRDFSPVSGTIKFFNELTNPRLDITAEYTGPHASNIDAVTNAPEIYKVVVRIVGMLESPQIELELYRKNSLTQRFDRQSKSKDELTADVLFFLAVGKFRADGPSFKEIDDVFSSVPSSFTNAVFSNFLGSSALRNYIRSISLEGGFSQASRLQIIGGYKDAFSFKLGSGEFSNRFLLGDYMVEIPLSTLATFDNARNYLIQLEAHLQDPSQTSLLVQQQQYVGRALVRIPLK